MRWPKRTLSERFWEKVDVLGPDDCWPWKAKAKHVFGYGIFQTGTASSNRADGSHRVAWELVKGPIPEGMGVLHSCDNPPCCNPSHMFLGTKGDNSDDMLAKGRNRFAHKISHDQAEHIRFLYEFFPLNQTELANQFGICQTQVGRIVRGERWKEG